MLWVEVVVLVGVAVTLGVLRVGVLWVCVGVCVCVCGSVLVCVCVSGFVLVSWCVWWGPDLCGPELWGPEGWGSEGWGTEGWGPEGGGEEGWGPEGWVAQNFALFFPSPATGSFLSSLSWVSSRGILVVFLKAAALKCACLEFSGCCSTRRHPRQGRKE